MMCLSPLNQFLYGNKNVVKGVAFSPEGATIASASYAHTVFLWDLNPESGMECARHEAGRNPSLDEWKSV
jgi:WD40 repeat protein